MSATNRGPAVELGDRRPVQFSELHRDSAVTAKNRAVGGTIKRMMDFTLAVTIFLGLLPLFLMVAAAIKILSPGPVFYGHIRIGHGGRPFLCWKFRTMCANGDAVLKRHLDENPSARIEWDLTRKLRDDPRVTRLGRVLRETSVDELPQLLNVIRGDMSLVGPRPVVRNELTLYGPSKHLYLAARPGITGPWQIGGRSTTAFEDRVALDSGYVTGWSVAEDLRILLMTVPAVVGARGAY